MTTTIVRGKSNPIGPVDPALAKLGFQRVRTDRKKRIIAELGGKTKTGKSRFGLTLTEEIGVLNTDRSLEDLLPEFPEVRVVVKDLSGMFDPGKELNQKEAVLIQSEFDRGYRALLASPRIKSVMVDKWNTVWEVVRYAAFGRASVKPHHYVAVNMQMRGYLAMAQQSDKNVLLIQDLKEEWVNEKPTGRWVVDGFKYTGGLAQLNLVASRDEEGGRDFHLEVTGCGTNAALVGWDFKNEKINFRENVAKLVLPDTEAKDWL
jgi:hypothetical protein